jgi:transposase
VTYFMGLDVSLEETAICVVDEVGEIFREGKTETEPEAISIWLKAVGVAVERLGLEAGPLSPWLSEGLQAAGLPAVCIEIRRMKGATAAMAVKTDRNDARAIAQAMRVGWFTAVHVKSAESQELRLLLTNRKTLLTSRVTLENEIRGTLKAFGLKVGRVSVSNIRGPCDRAHRRPAAAAGNGASDAGGASGIAASV